MGTTLGTTRRELVSKNWVVLGPAEKAEHSLCPTSAVYWLVSLVCGANSYPWATDAAHRVVAQHVVHGTGYFGMGV